MLTLRVEHGPRRCMASGGFLLFHLCPVEGDRNTELMWIIVGATTIISPITLWLGRKWLDVQTRKRAMDERAAKAPA